MASSGGAPSFFVGFGVVFVLCAIGVAIYNFYNATATATNRFSEYDITSHHEETDPLDPSSACKAHCPFCGCGVTQNFQFCPKCGKQIPKP